MEIFDRIKSILFNPKEEWTVIEAENETHANVFTKYLLILALIPALAYFAKEYMDNRSMLNKSIEVVENGVKNRYRGYSGNSEITAEQKVKMNQEIAKGIDDVTKNFPISNPFNTTKWSIIFAVSLFVIIVGGAYLSAAIINALSNQFGSEKDFNRAFSLVAYSLTPLCIAGILYAFHSFASFVPYIGLYGVYLLYLGVESQLKPVTDKKMTAIIISAITIVAVLAALSKIVVPEIQKKVMTDEYISVQQKADPDKTFEALEREAVEKMAEVELNNHKY